MLFPCCLLLLITLLGGGTVFVLPKPKTLHFQWALLFAGGYLFANTLLHLFPELFANHPAPEQVGLYILMGFFLQSSLELFSQGIEHGHIHPQRGVQPASFVLLISLFIHALLDGAILSNPMVYAHHSHSLLFGILLHKALEAFSLVSVLQLYAKKSTMLLCLVLFSCASPLGLLISQYYSQQLILSAEGITLLSALASGNFLHIATTILFESSPGHRLSIPKLLASGAGAGVAVGLAFCL